MPLEIFLVAGESSADFHGAELLKELKAVHPDLKCFGVGGTELKKQGMEIFVPSSSLNIVGGSDWIGKAAEVLRSYRTISKIVRVRKPDLAILLDLPDFNLKIAGELKALKIPIVYYISPQVWAWRKYRIEKIKRTVNKMLVVFPFEKNFYEKHGVSVQFVGHPLLEKILPRKEYRQQCEILNSPRVAILPGSRQSEVRFHSETICSLVRKLKAQFPLCEIRIPIANTLETAAIKKAFESVLDSVILEEGAAHQVLEWADVAAVASGTATLETALIGTPFCLFYRTSFSSAWLFRTFSRYKGFIGMPNILQGKEVAKEFFQEKANPLNLFEECFKIINSQGYRESMTKELKECRDKLGIPGASRRAALEVKQLLLEFPSKNAPNALSLGPHVTTVS